jgi:hypothetical protein
MVDPDASVYVNGNLTNTDKTGNFKTVVQLGLGKNTITVQAKDPLGNTVSYSYLVQRNKVPPQQKPPTTPGGGGGCNNCTGINSAGGLLVPVLIVMTSVAVIGVCVGLYMRKRGKGKEAEVSSGTVQPVAPTTQNPPIAPPPVGGALGP